MSSSVTISLDAAGAMLADGGSRDALLDILPKLSDESAKQLAPLVCMAVGIDSEYIARFTIERMLKTHPEWVNATHGGYGDTAMIAAARAMKLDLIDLLASRGANARKRNDEKMNALDVAVKHLGNYRLQAALMDSLLETGQFTQREKNVVLEKAAADVNLGAVQSLLRHGADFMVSAKPVPKGSIGTALAAACLHYDEDGAGEALKIVETMLEHPAAAKVLNDGWHNPDFGAPLHCAAFVGNSIILRRLMDAGAWINPPADMGEATKTPLMFAAFGLNPTTIRSLLEAGADASLTDQSGKNAIHHLAQYAGGLGDDDSGVRDKFLLALTLLADAGADPFACDNQGNSPLDLARKNHQSVLATTLEARHEAMRMERDTAVATGGNKNHLRL